MPGVSAETTPELRPEGDLRVGDWIVRPSLNRITKGDVTVHLEPRLMSLLLFLAENAGKVVSKDDITRAVWEGRLVVDSALTRAFAKLRQALGDDAQSPRFIETISKRGYRLVALVAPVEGESRLPWRWTTATALLALALAASLFLLWVRQTPAPSPVPPSAPTFVAVLPLKDLSPESGGEFFAEGMTEALITDLAKVRSLRVISRRSVETFRDSEASLAEIAGRLGVEALVEGSVLRSGGRVRISVQLVHVATDSHLWAESYEREWADVLALQGEVARAIAREVRAAMSPEDEERLADARRLDPEVHETYLRARHFLNKWSRDALEESIELFRHAIELDPSYAPAYAGLADAHSFLGGFNFVSAEEAFPQARAAARKALELDPGLGEAHLALAYVAFLGDLDWTSAAEHLRHALVLNPSYAQAHERRSYFLTCMGLFDEAVEDARRALELDPLTSTTHMHLGWVYWNAGRYELSIAQLQRTLGLDPDLSRAHAILAWSYAKLGRFTEAIAEAEEYLERTGGEDGLSTLGWVQGVAGEHEAARATLTRLFARSEERYTSPYDVAIVYAGLGEADHALEWLEKAWEARTADLVYLGVEPFFDTLRGDPRYRDLQERVGF